VNGRALVLAAHGAGDGSAANRQTLALADELRRRGAFDEVAAAFRLGEPAFSTVLDGLRSCTVTVVPLMTSAGHYLRSVLPSELARNARYGSQRLWRTAPLGQWPALHQAVRRRVQDVLARHRLVPEQTAVAVAAHGTPRNPHSRESAAELGTFLQRQFPQLDVLCVFIDDTPAIEQLFSLTSRPMILTIPFLMGGGPHAQHDVPARLGLNRAAHGELLDVPAQGRRLIFEEPLSNYPELPQLILDMAEPAQPAGRCGRGAALRLGTRGSRLALRQAEIVAGPLRAAGHTIEMVGIDTAGDRDLDRPIADLPGAAPFAGDIEQALLKGRIDLAVHSLKDLPEQPTPGLTLAAILRRGPAQEALVSRAGLTLSQLPAGAVVGTSSDRRSAQVLALRPDLRVAPIRGPVDDRVRQVHEGRFDAAILALAGLSRLGLDSAVTQVLDIEDFLPAPGQGALAVQVRIDDARTQQACAGLDDPPTRRATAAELSFLRLVRDATGQAASAYADAHPRLQLRVGVTEPLTGRARTAVVAGEEPHELARAASAQICSGQAAALDSPR
jgi:hydroxymethylbilane synthase